MNSAARSLRARRKLLHVAVMALNFTHDRAPLKSLELLRRQPSQAHRRVYTRLMVLIKACVLSDVATVARRGRKSFQFDARVHELFNINHLLYMPFMEPNFNQFDIRSPKHLCPDVRPDDPHEVSRLAKVWDARGLLRLVPSELAPADYRLFTRVFNNYKPVDADRQIGDRRGTLLKGDLRKAPHTFSLHVWGLRTSCRRGMLKASRDCH